MFTRKAPAKINLRLKVTGRRSKDGYHFLSMFNVTVGLCDEVSLKLSKLPEVRLSVDGVEGCLKSELSEPDKNIMGRAAHRFLEEFNLVAGLEIQLFKKIPVGAGLGGGSSDAAAVLLLLKDAFSEELCSRGVSIVTLQKKVRQIALELGSDVPYFLSGGFAYVSGTGEKVRPLDTQLLEGREVLILKPDESISTPLVYSEFRQGVADSELGHDNEAEKFLERFEHLSEKNFEPAFYPLICNDLTETVFNISPPLRDHVLFLNKKLNTRIICGVSGSGSAIFALPGQGRKFSAGSVQEMKEFAAFNKLAIYYTALLAI